MLILIALLAGAQAAAGAPASPSASAVIIHSEVTIRVPMRRPVAGPGVSRWREKKGPKCVSADGIAGAAVTGPSSVDFILKGGARIRARLESACPALDYYSGFYISPMADGQICADRDAIHARSGGECEIDRFRSLKPAKP